MIEPNSVSPLLDGFQIGSPIGTHCGIRCCPAVCTDSDRKYIVKVISIPASQTQLEALLITGAYKDPADAAAYFHSQAEDLLKEVDFLQKMSQQHGFLPYEGSQIEPMQKNQIGYEVYLLAGFRLSLERYMHRKDVTHLEAVNLGIDLCAALAECRKEGMLYISLKPANIYISTQKEYKIGDLGFVPLSSLKYTSMPEKYRSCYTAPELQDDLSVLNETADTYAVGMILYQLFNNGLLPADPTAALPVPMNADEEMAAIILKACDPDPAKRWADPVEMGQALVAYMQANTINDTPIMAPITPATLGKTGPDTFETARFQIPAALLPKEEPEKPAEDVPPAEETQEDAPEDIPQEEEIPQEVTPSEEAEEAPQEEVPVQEAETPQEAAEEPAVQEEAAPTPPTSDGVAQKIEAAAAAEFASLTGMDESENAVPMFLDEEHLDTELKELNKILTPDSAPKKAPKKHPNIKPVVIDHEKKKSPVTKFFIWLLVLALLAAAGFWGYIFYETEYMKTVKALTVTGSLDQMVVTIDSEIPDSLLNVVCTDAYGNSNRSRVRDGQATFQNLSPDSMYKIQLEILGVHKLRGATSEIFNTESMTNVSSFTAMVGDADGSVVLNLITEGHEPDQWQVFYTAEGEPELGATFSGHTTTIRNLTVGKRYSFHLETAKHQAVNGQTEIYFTAGQNVAATNLSIVSCEDGVMTVQWDSPRGEAADSWTVHCYGDDYDEYSVTNDYTMQFTGIDSSKAYTVEVSARGMSQVAKVSISANPITLTDFYVDASNPQELFLTWDCEGAVPEGGWLVSYTLDGSNLPSVMKADIPALSILPRIPGAVYHFSIQTAGGVTIFNNAQTYVCPETTPYTGHGLNDGSLISFKMLNTPEQTDWSRLNLLNSAYTSEFVAGDPISLVLYCPANLDLNAEPINVLYVFEDEYGNALTELVAEEVVDWYEMWYRDDVHYAELNVPTSPIRPGSYTLSVYFNGYSAGSANLTVY